jgi:hypothetical protein
VTPKRTLEEIVLIYETERALVDLFCEGHSDAAVLKFFVEGREEVKTAVYDADQIEWPDEIGSEGGNRARMVFLSNALSSRGLKGICVIDKDLDTIKDKTATNGILLKTDYACLDMYGLEPDDLGTFIYSRFNIDMTDEDVRKILDACKHLFAIRFLREEHCAGSSIADVRRMISDGKNIEFAVDSYLERCKQLNGYDTRWDKVIEKEAETFDALNGDFRDYINVHDLGTMLAAIIRSIKSGSVSIETNFIERHCAYVILSLRNFGFPFFSQISSKLF